MKKVRMIRQNGVGPTEQHWRTINLSNFLGPHLNPSAFNEESCKL